MKRYFSLPSFTLGFLVGAFCVALWLSDGLTLPNTFPSGIPPQTQSSTIEPQTFTESGAISIENQSAGTSVLVESVTVPPPGVWIAVREVSGNDLGNVLGAVRVTGPRSQITIPLLRATGPDTTYAVELYRDNGDDQFDLSSDSVYVDFSTSAPVIVYFHTSAMTE